MTLRPAATMGIALALVLAGCGSGAGGAPEDGVFAYDAGRPLEFRDRGVVNEDYPISVRDVSFRAGDDVVKAYLVVPPGDGPFPAAVYVHGAGGDRSSMLVPATWLAARGAVTLAIDAPSRSVSEVKGTTMLGRLESHRDVVVRDVVAVRRAVDLLAARDDVDPDRIGYVGWSAGARTGALLSGADPRLRALVLVAAGSALVSEFVSSAPEESREAVERVMSSIDPLAFIARARGDRLLIQEGERDEVVPRTAIDNLVEAAPHGADVRWYDADHTVGGKAYADHLDWLEKKLEIAGPRVPGAQTGP